MKITPIDVIKSMTGKVCMHSDTYVSLNTTSGKMFTGKRCYPRDLESKPYTSNELANQSKFKTISQ